MIAAFARYEIRVAGQVDPQWAEWLAGLTMTHEAGGTTLLAGPVRDQAELHGVLSKLRDLNVTLLLVQRLEAERPAATGPE